MELGTFKLELSLLRQLGTLNLELGTWNFHLGTFFATWNFELGTWNFLCARPLGVSEAWTQAAAVARSPAIARPVRPVPGSRFPNPAVERFHYPVGNASSACPPPPQAGPPWEDKAGKRPHDSVAGRDVNKKRDEGLGIRPYGPHGEPGIGNRDSGTGLVSRRACAARNLVSRPHSCHPERSEGSRRGLHSAIFQSPQ